jgi:flagellar M-ring protein FliF
MPAMPPAAEKPDPLLVLAIGITARCMMFLWKDQAGYKPVFGAREKVAPADMMNVLDAEKIPYRVHPDSGQVLVPDDELGKVRMLLASKGVTAQLPAGLELMDKNDPLGVSQFVQDVRFRRGLEGELAQHPDHGRDRLGARAPVDRQIELLRRGRRRQVLGLGGGRGQAGPHAGAEQIAAIVNLVSGSVASLAPARVSLVDQAGNYLSSRVDLTDGFDGGRQGDDRRQALPGRSARQRQRAARPVLGATTSSISVTADVDNDKVEETQEKYGEAPKVTSEAMREETGKEPPGDGRAGHAVEPPAGRRAGRGHRGRRPAGRQGRRRHRAQERHHPPVRLRPRDHPDQALARPPGRSCRWRWC